MPACSRIHAEITQTRCFYVLFLATARECPLEMRTFCHQDGSNEERAAFVEHFYASLFATQSVTSSFEHATRMLRTKGLGKGASLYIKCFLPTDEYGIAINMDAIADKIDDLGMTREEVLHRIAWRMPIDRRLLKGARDDALIPIADDLLGTFSGTNLEDIACNRLARSSANAPEEQVRLWRALLKSYNYLAASKYRNLQRPANPAFKHELKTAIGAFEFSIENDLLGNSDKLVRLGFRRLLPHIAQAETECVKASDRLLLGNCRGVVLALETALTHYHTLVSGIQPAVTQPISPQWLPTAGEVSDGLCEPPPRGYRGTVHSNCV